NGVYKSTDGGMSFEKLASTSIPDMNYCNLIVHSVTDASTVWLGTSRGLFYTKNGGESWTKLPVLNLSASSISGIISFPDSSLMVAIQGVRMYKTPKPTVSPFVGISDSIFPKTSIGRIMIANCSKAFPNTVYSFYSNGAGLDPVTFQGPSAYLASYKSTDGGATWTQLSKQTLNIGSTQSNYNVMLGVHPTNPNFLVLGAQFAVYSRNGGINFTSFDPGHADNHVYCHAGSRNGNDFFIGNDGGIYKGNVNTIATGVKDMSRGYVSAQYYAGNYGPTGISCISGTQDNGTWRYVNGVASKFYGGDGAYSHISQQNPGMLYCATQNGNTYFKNGPANIVNITPGVAVTEGVNFINQYEINYAAGNQLYYRSNKGIWRSINNGIFWDKLNKTNISNISAIGVTRDANPTVYLGGQGVFYRIENAATRPAGETLKNISSMVHANMRSSAWGTISFHPGDETTMFVGLTSISTLPRAWKGINVNTDTMKWVSISGNLPKNLSVYQIHAHPDSPESVLFAATDFGLYYTLDGGQNWLKETRMPNVAIFEMKLRPSDKKLFLFTHGRSTWYLEMKDLNSVNTVDSDYFADLKIYPNPVNEKLQIEIQSEVSTAQIFDITGREILTVQNTKQIDVSNLRNGTYLLKIFDTNGKYMVRKFIKA
ncbi:MAG: T9SS type A sorting domain-containing protein, partial [Saprospiraceae bacterium]